MSLRLAVLGTGAVGGSMLDLAGDCGYEAAALADSSSSMVDPDDLDPSAVRDCKEREGMVGGADLRAAFGVDYDVLVEAAPTTLDGAEPGFSYVERVLVDGHHVALTNKGPVAEWYADLHALEAKSGGTVQLEAAVGDAIPISSTISDLGASHVIVARDVLNETANFILSRMATEGLDYEYVLAKTQDPGVAEADPTLDVDGIDAALRFVILANVLSDGKTEYALDDTAVEGIRSVPGTTLDLAAEDGRTVRLIGEIAADGVRVVPRLILQGSVLSIMGTQNIVQLEIKHAGQLSISGHGTGGLETVTAVLSGASRLE